MTCYLSISMSLLPIKVILHQHSTHLLYLICLGLIALWLEVENLLQAILRKDVMVPTHALIKAQAT